ALAIIIGLLIWQWRSPTRGGWLAVGLIIGGAIGNVVDRLRLGAVVDFLDFHLAGYHWPAVNVADSAITIGVFVIIIAEFLPKAPNQDKRAAKEP
ncbi:MAG: signal peptidase II, partial [Kiloniellales bacterium]|nr:signal peptidase II [Kiloniellales bacterium]